MNGTESSEGTRAHAATPAAVRQFYERMPYPAPFTSLDEHRDLYRNPDRRRASAAVLINRAHPFTDLVLCMSPFEDRLFGLVDGRRSLGEILQAAATRDSHEQLARDFFERLWQYDQVVLDASSTS